MTIIKLKIEFQRYSVSGKIKFELVMNIFSDMIFQNNFPQLHIPYFTRVSRLS